MTKSPSTFYGSSNDKNKNQFLSKALGGAAIGSLLFVLQVYGISAVIDNLKKPEIRDYVLAPSQAVRFYSGETEVAPTEEVVTIEETEIVPETVVPPEVVIDRFQMACMSFAPITQRMIKMALIVGSLQLAYNFMRNLYALVSDSYSPQEKVAKALPFLIMDITLIFSLINLFTALSATITDTYGEADDICLRIEGNNTLSYLRFNAIFWLVYSLLYIPLYAYDASQLK